MPACTRPTAISRAAGNIWLFNHNTPHTSCRIFSRPSLSDTWLIVATTTIITDVLQISLVLSVSADTPASICKYSHTIVKSERFSYNDFNKGNVSRSSQRISSSSNVLTVISSGTSASVASSVLFYISCDLNSGTNSWPTPSSSLPTRLSKTYFYGATHRASWPWVRRHCQDKAGVRVRDGQLRQDRQDCLHVGWVAFLQKQLSLLMDCERSRVTS